ncbi:MAG TPA: adenylate/guanylate cyclase domain-containing protein [Planctomycetota bacterium]|nr:adenylate/guanylate cyclase domain-containing protein [Planctomycetota bacterium]
MKKGTRAPAAAALAFAGAALAFVLHATGLLTRVESISWDARTRLLATPAPEGLPIRLVLVDDESLARVSREQGVTWPWPREYYAALLRYLVADGARAVVFDFDFPEPSRYGVDDDRALHDALAAAPRAVLPLRLKGRAREWPWAPAPLDAEGADRAPEAPGATFSSADVVGGLALLYGHVVADADRDGVVRRVRPLVRFAGKGVPALALAACLRGAGGETPRLALHGDTLVAFGREIPLADGRLVLRYRRPGERGHLYPAHSAAGILADVSNGTPPHGLFRDAYVLVGTSAENLFDNWPTPVKTVAPGVEVHATLLDNLLHGDLFRPAPAALPPLLALAASFAGAWLVLRARSAATGLAASAAALALPAAAAVAAHAAGIAWPFAWPVAAAFLAVAGAGAVGYATEGRQRRYLRRAFEHYVSPQVIARIVDDPAQLRLGGERREVSIFVSDVEGFSSFAEGMDPQDLARFLNDYLGAMTAVLLDEGSTLDKYEGDGIVAFWNAPVAQPDHAQRAIRAAVRCQRVLASRAGEFAARIGRPLRMRVGVHTGIVSVGNFGSRRRFDYTVLGDAVNLASRLEGANKRFGTAALVSEETWRGAGPGMLGREIGRVRVVGRVQPVRVSEPWTLAGEPEPPLLRAFETARRLCLAARWDEARAALEACAGDPVAALWRERVEALRARGATEWDDVFELREK